MGSFVESPDVFASDTSRLSQLPRLFDLRMGKIVRFMPDVGHLAIAIMTLGVLLATAQPATVLLAQRRRATDRRDASIVDGEVPG